MYSRGFGLSTIHTPRVCSNIGDLKIFKVAPKYQSGRRVDMILRSKPRNLLENRRRSSTEKMFIDL
ncbi:hypothetical protein GIB67_012322 [Kingdonia uniflora]|uniref:Uncharacterized protein n=1 Tax=Kingdonia uniflora TaxID=39325 RepID=A0A7J7MVH1_9MAGN|nr:hypothetical protein GIB67_012322 [Kingdonia uniflora]